MFQIWFQKSTSILFQRSFFNNFSFLTDLLEYACVLLLIDSLRYEKCSSILPDLMLLVVGVRKRAVHNECQVLGMKSIVHELCFLENCDKLSESVEFSRKFRYFKDQNGPAEGPHENEFWTFRNEYYRLEKVDEKDGVICLVSMLPS